MEEKHLEPAQKLLREFDKVMIATKHWETAQNLILEYDTEHIEFAMDDGIREELHSRYLEDDFESFLAKYCERHAEKFDEDFYESF